MTDITYLYGFLPATTATPPRALSGVHGAPVTLLAIDEVAAVLSHVPSAEFSPDVIDANIQDMNWVGARGLEHERVVAWFVDNAEILPVPLFTLFSSDAALRSDVAPRSAAVRAQLQRLHLQREWDLKVSYDHAALEAHAADVMPEIAGIDDEIAAAAAGKRFLLERKRADLLKRELSGAARRRARDLLDRLSDDATAVVALPIPRAVELPVVLNAALLVHRDRESAFRAAAAEHAAGLHAIGITAQLTGPWAPYRFTGEPNGAAG